MDDVDGPGDGGSVKSAPDVSVGAELAHVFALGRRMHLAGGLVVAERAYRQVLAGIPDQPDALHYLGMIAFQTGRGAEALDLLRQAVAARPDDAETVSDLGVVCREMGENGDAITFGRRSVELAPDQAQNHARLANALRENKQFDDAEKHYLIALEMNPDNIQILTALYYCAMLKDDTLIVMRRSEQLKALNYIKYIERIKPGIPEVKQMNEVASQRIGFVYRQNELADGDNLNTLRAFPSASKMYHNLLDNNARLITNLNPGATGHVITELDNFVRMKISGEFDADHKSYFMSLHDDKTIAMKNMFGDLLFDACLSG